MRFFLPLIPLLFLSGTAIPQQTTNPDAESIEDSTTGDRLAENIRKVDSQYHEVKQNMELLEARGIVPRDYRDSH